MKKILSMILCINLVVVLFTSCRKDSKSEGDLTFVNNLDFSNIQIGDKIKIGIYEQDNDFANGKELIEWSVLDKTEDKALVISEFALDAQSYNNTKDDITWENYSLRKWLNNDFFNSAFNNEEKDIIMDSTVENMDNSQYVTEGGNDTIDKVFILSIEEANKYFSAEIARRCKPTQYAIENDIHMTSLSDNCWWWLRSPGKYNFNFAYVDYMGKIDYDGYCPIPSVIPQLNLGIRPAMWISIK